MKKTKLRRKLARWFEKNKRLWLSQRASGEYCERKRYAASKENSKLARRVRAGSTLGYGHD